MLSKVEGSFNQLLNRIDAGEDPTENDFKELRFFLYLQFQRTEMSVLRLSHTYGDMSAHALDIGNAKAPPIDAYKLMIESLRACMEGSDSISDLKTRLIENRSRVDFVISDDPVIFANRYATQRLKETGYGVDSSGVFLLMPLSTRIAVICYDSQVYTAPRLIDGRLIVERDDDADAINQFQYLKASENVYFRNIADRDRVIAEFNRYKGNRPSSWSKADVLVQDDAGTAGALLDEDGVARNYRIATPEEGRTAKSVVLKMNHIYPVPDRWFPQLTYRANPKTFYQGLGAGHMRKKGWRPR